MDISAIGLIMFVGLVVAGVLLVLLWMSEGGLQA